METNAHIGQSLRLSIRSKYDWSNVCNMAPSSWWHILYMLLVTSLVCKDPVRDDNILKYVLTLSKKSHISNKRGLVASRDKQLRWKGLS